MKKALIVLLMLAVMAGGLFAEISLSGSASSGLAVFIGDDVLFATYNNPDRSIFQSSISVSGKNEAGTAGASLGLGWNFGGVSGSSGNAWFKPLDSLTVNIGRNWNWWKANPPGFIGDANNQIDVGFGLFLDGNPGGGLRWGAGIYPTYNDGSFGGFGDARYGGYLIYNLGIVEVGANIDYNGNNHWGGPGSGKVDATVGVGTNVAGISLAVDAWVQNLQDFSASGDLQVGPEIGFGAGDLSATLGGIVFVPVSGQKLGVYGNLSGDYPVTDAITASLAVGFSLKQALEASNGTFNFWTAGSIPQGYATEVDSSVLGINPNLAINLSAGGSLNIGYGFATNIGGAKAMQNAIYAYYTIGF